MEITALKFRNTFLKNVLWNTELSGDRKCDSMKANLTKRCLSLLLTLCMLLGVLPTAMAMNGSTYSDTQGHWAESSIERWSDYGIIQGNNGKFNPSGNLTRAHMAAILSRLLKLPEAADAGFKDVNGEWFADSINRCAAAGIMLGDNGYANPNATITRQQAVVMLGRALGIQPVKNADLSQYTDADQVSAYAVGYVAAMAEAGIVKGTTATTLSPLSNINRAATVTILDRAIEVYANEQGMKVEAEGTGLVLVVADKVKVTAPEGTVVVVPAHVKNTVVNGEKVVGGQAYEAPAELPAIGGGGGGGGFVPPTAEDMPDITEPTTVSGGTYQNVTITEDVANGEVTLSDLTINGDLTIQGGGSGTIKLIRCVIRGKIIMEKDSSASEAQPPRVLLTATNVPVVEATQPAIIESADGSAVTNLTVKADVTIQGTQTSVKNVTVPTDAAAPTVSVADGAKVTTVVVQSPATVAADAGAAISNVTAQDDVSIASGSVGTVTVPAAAENVEIEVQTGAALDQLNAQGNGTTIAADGAVNNVTAQKNVTVASGSVGTVTVPATADAVRITVDSGATVEDLSINKTSGTTITNNGTVESVSSDLATVPEFTSNGDNAIDPETVHFHKWDQGEITTPATCTSDGVLTYTCEAEGCTDPAATKTHVILASGHDWAKEWTAVEGTDTHERVCANDPAHKDVAAHTWNAGVITTAATCTTAGEKLFTCTGCKATRTEVIAALGHDFDSDGVYDGKDAENHWYLCNRGCGEKSVSAHTVVTDAAVAATCTTTGLTEGSHCSDCNYVIVAQTVIAALGHDFTGEYSKDETGHWHVCAREGCEVTDNKLAHTFDTKNCEQDATCTACAYVKPAGQHAWNTGVITKAANCTADGVKTYTCTSCGDTKTETIPALGHDFDSDGIYDGMDASGHWYICNRYCGAKNVMDHTVVTDKAVAATCTTTGLTEGSHCSDCNYVIVRQTLTPVLGHDFTGEYSKDEIGHWHVCSRCDATDNKLAHTFDTKNCEQDATCTVCAYVKPAGQHAWNAGVITKAATCTDDGVKTYTCTSCGDTKTEVIAALGHDFDTDGIYDGMDATGHWYICNRYCGAKNVLDHTVVTDKAVAATCTTTGLTEGSHCSDCNYVIAKQTLTAVLGHDFTGEYSKDEIGHWHVCSRCDATDNKLAHTFDTKNCAEKATCTVCKYEKAAGEHTWNAGTVTTAPTCETDGVKTYTCNSCYDTKTEAVPALGHKWSTWMQYNAEQHYHYCTNNYNHTEYADHAFGDDYTCDDCGYGKSATYSVFIRHMQEELGTVKDALQIVNGKLQITIPGYGTYGVGQTLPQITREGWTYNGWSVGVDDGSDGWAFQAENLTALTADVEKELLKAIDNGHLIFLNCIGEPMGANGFSVELSVDTYDMGYKLIPPADRTDAMYYLTFVSTDRASSYSCSVWAEKDYEGFVMASQLPESGHHYFGAFEVRDEKNNLLAVAADGDSFPAFFASIYGDLANHDTPVVTINYAASDANNIVYEISGLTTMMNYQLTDSKGSMYILGDAIDTGKVTLTTSVNNPLSGPAKLHGVAAFNNSGFGMETMKPVTVSVPTFDPNQVVTPDSGYQVSNIHFEDGYLMWAAPTAVAGMNVDYQVRLYSNGKQKDNCGTNSLDVALAAFEAGSYDKVRISTVINGEEKDSVEQAINLTITQGADKAAPSSVVFDELTTAAGVLYGYQMTVTGLTPNALYIFRVKDFNGNANFHDVMSDDTGKAMTTYNDVELVKTGFYEIVEQTSSPVSNNGLTCTTTFSYLGEATKCLPATNTVWFKAYNDGSLELIWDYEELSNASDYDFYRIEVYNSLTGEWVKLTEESIGSVSSCMNCPRCEPGIYTKVRLTAMKEEQDSNGEWYISAKEPWFEADINLTIGEEATAPTATIVKNSNGEHTFSIANLFGQMNSSVEVMNSEEADGRGYRYGDSFPTNGYGTATLTVDWPYVETGYYRVREFVDMTASGTTAAFDIRNSGWQKCFDCGHTVSNTAPVSNIRLDGSWIVWDEPTVANPDYGYEISLSEDGGQTWSVTTFRGNRNDLMTVYLKEGNYNAVRVKTYLTESCGCDVEVGMVLDTTFSLKVTETEAATPATVTFTPVDGATDTYTATIKGLQPYGNYDLGLAMEANGDEQCGSYGGPSADANGKAIRENLTPWSGADFLMKDVLTDGYYLLTEFALDNSADGKTGTLDRITHGDWTKSVIGTSTYSDEAWFEVKGDGSLYFCWDMTPMANADDYANGYSVYFNDGTNWERVDGAGKNNSFWRVNSPGVEAGSYIGIKLVGRNSSGAETSTWFETACALDIVSTDPSEATVTFTENTDGTYNVEVSDMTTAAQVAELVVSDKEGLGDIDYMVDDLGGYTSTLFENETISYPNGYYRVREYSSLYADKLTARFGIFESAWTKMNLDGSATNEYQVSNIRFEDYYGNKMLMWDAPATTDDVKYRVYVKDANGEWDEVSGTSQTLLGIADADFNGTYTGIMVRTILKSDNSVKAETTADLSLTVNHKTSATAATVSYTQKDPADDYWFYENTSGLTPNVQYEIYLRHADGTDAGTFGGTADADGKVVNSECGSSNLAEALDGGSYLVYEYTDYALSADGKTLSYTCTKLGDWTKFESGSTGTDPVFGTPVLKTDGTFIWMELTVQNVDDPSKLTLWTKHTYTYTSSSSSSTNQYSNELYQYQLDGNTLKLYQAGNVLVNQENHSVQLAVKDPATGIMSEYTTNSLVYGTETTEDISVTAVKVPASETDKYNRLNITRADGANFAAGHYHIKRPSTMDYTNMHYVEADKATLSISSSDTAILGTTSVTPKKIVPVLNADGNIVMNKAVYNTYTFNDVVLADIASAAGSGVVSAAKGVPVSLTMTIPSGVELKTTTPTITCRMYSTTISNVVVDGNKITFDANFGNLYRDEDTLFYLADTDTNLGYPLCTETLAIDHIEVLNVTAQSNVTELQLGFGEAVTFYNADGTAITATDTATVHQQIAEKIAVYKDGKDMGLTFDAGYTYGDRNFYFIYGGTGALTEDADYTVVFKDGVYFRSTSNPDKGYIGDINIRYLGPSISTCQVNLSTGVMTLRVDAQDRVAETLPTMDFTKLSIACAPSGYWSYDEYQTDLVGDYAMVDGTAPTEKGTYTITKWVAEKYNSGGYVYERRFWDLSIMLTDADLALYQSVADDYNGTDQFHMVTHDGWMTGSAKESLTGGLTIMKNLTIQNETDAYVYYDYSSNNHSASGSVWSGGTNSLSMYFAAESINLTYNGTKIAVALPADGILVVKEELFAQA